MASIKFQTKEQSKKEQEEAFLALSPSERFVQFLRLSEKIAKFQGPKKDFGNNFVIERKKE